MLQGNIREQFDPKHPEKLKPLQRLESNDGNAENVGNQEVESERQPDQQATAEAVAEFLKKDEVISPELQKVRQTINQVEEKSDVVNHQQLVADILNGKVDPVKLEKIGSPFNIKQIQIGAKKYADQSRN